ncbi:MAG: family 78 glycoside hydrolase catalytic domain [Phycisphaerae bacterium]
MNNNPAGNSQPPNAKPRDSGMDRRRFLGVAAIGVSALCAARSAEAAATAGEARTHVLLAAPTVCHLTCEFMVDPLGIDTTKPRLGWQLVSSMRGARQSGYQILVASAATALRDNLGDLWDSGKVRSEECANVIYNGKPLQSSMIAHWKVRIWDQNGTPGAWSEPAVWEMGLLEPTDWHGTWIGAPMIENADSFDTPPAPYFRTVFQIDKPLKSAHAYICGLGYYEFYLNGAKVGDQVLAPAQTDYSQRNLSHLLYPVRDNGLKRVLYNTYDITSHLRPGHNAVGVILGNGWYNQRARRVEGWMWYGQPRLILQMRLEFTDGTSTIVATTPQWKVTTGPILQDAIFTGETYDARREVPGWCHPDFDDSAWPTARTIAAPTGPLTAQLAPYDWIVGDLAATALTQPVRGLEGQIFQLKPGVYGFDFGQNFAGWVRLKLRQPTGTKIRIDYIEDSGLRYGQSDTYIAKGLGEEVYEPRFTWHGFRYIEITGCSTAPEAAAVTGRSVHTDVAEAGDFECSSHLLNQIYGNYRRTELADLHGAVPMSDPHRERLGYGGDGQVSAQSAIYSFDMHRLYIKWAQDLADAQGPNSGFVPHTAPFEGGGGGPAWGSACVLIPWYVYLYYGDRRILHQHYDVMKKWVAFLETRTNRAGIVTHEEPGGWCLGDWATPETIAIPPELVNTCYLAHLCNLMARIAALVHRPDDITAFRRRFAISKQAINTAFFNSAAGYYSIGRQGADVFPLAFGLVPSVWRHKVFAHIVNHLETVTHRHFDTGILATPLLLEVLTRHGRADLALALMSQTTYPSYGWQIAHGATTLWESWNGMGSHMHIMFGSVCAWMFHDLAGIKPDPDAPGFRQFTVRPVYPPGLTWVRAYHLSPYGQIDSAWRRDGKRFTMDITIPASTSAKIYFPHTDVRAIQESGRLAASAPGLNFEGVQQGCSVFKATSGTYILDAITRGGTTQQ